MYNFGKLLSVNTTDNKVILNFAERKARLEIIRDDIINVFCGFESDDHKSKAIETEKSVPTEFTTEFSNGTLTLKTKCVTVTIKDNMLIDFADAKGNILCSDTNCERTVEPSLSEDAIKLMEQEGHIVTPPKSDYNIFVQKKVFGDEHFYGLGDKLSPLDKKYYQFISWNTDEPRTHTEAYESLYKTLPFLITLKDNGVYGLFFDNTYFSVFNLAKENENYYWYGTDNGNLDYYYFAGNSVADIVGAYTYLTGTTPLPQLWTLGYQQSRWGYITQKDIEDVAENMRKYSIPCDAVHLDIDYMDAYKVFTFNSTRWPDPKKAITTLKDKGFKTITIIDPGVKAEEGYYVYDEGVKNNYFCTTPEGENYHNVVWPGDTVFPDFSNKQVRDWWAQNIKFLTDNCVSGVWNDMNEPSTFNGFMPNDIVMYDNGRKSNHAEMHNVYGHNMSRATYEGLKKHTGKRPFVITRACYAGSQKYTTAWTGDNQSLWAHLKMAIPQLTTLGLNGMSFAGTDLCGFSCDTTPELAARWMELGIFFPLCRNHSANGTKHQEPWCFNEEVIDIFRKYLNLRYTLLPYFYDLFYQGEKTGFPIMRPLVFRYSSDPITHTLNGEFTVGDNILVAPVTDQGETHKTVYLPEGNWYDYWTKEKISGKNMFIRSAELDVCPIYIKENSIIPKFPEQLYVGEKEIDNLKLEIYGDDCEYEHYSDNGSDFNYQQGEYNLYKFTFKNGVFSASLTHNGYAKKYKTLTIQTLNKTVTVDFADNMQITI